MNRAGKGRISLIVAIVVPIVVAVVLLIVGVCFLRKRASNTYLSSFRQDSSNLSFSVKVIVSYNLFPLTLIWLLIITVFLGCVVVDDLTDVESLQFDMATVEAATNRFSDENKIGRGGFGVVYKV